MTSPLSPSPGSFAIAGDWHQNLRWATRMVEYLATEDIHMIIHTGDFLGFGQAMHQYLKMLNLALQEAEAVLMFVDGNHEDHPYLLSLPRDSQGVAQVEDRIFHLGRGTRWEWDGLKFLAMGGATSVDKQWRSPGLDWFPQEAITMKQLLDVAQEGYADVMITHDCPSGVSIPGLWSGWPAGALETAMSHRADLGRLVDMVDPKYLFHGHCHTRYGARRPGDRWDCLINGLDCDGTTESDNLIMTTVDEMKAGLDL
jgi:predicted phosphodiesterase